jgi:hypothetical protein
MDSTLNAIVSKITSIRAIITVMLVYTYCWSITQVFALTATGIIKVDFLQGFVTGSLGSIVLMIAKEYFDRDDRNNKPNGTTTVVPDVKP